MVTLYNTRSSFRLSKRETKTLVSVVLAEEGYLKSEIQVILINDAMMIKLNTEFLNHNYTTDVLSFLLSEEHESILEGEVYVNLDQALRQAKDYHVPVKNEIGRLIIHGVLHLLGYDDSTTKQKKQMREKEDYYLENFGLRYFHA